MVRRADNLTTFMCRLSWNEASISRNPQGLSRPLRGIPLPHYVIFNIEFFSSLGPSLPPCSLFCGILSVPLHVRRSCFTPRAIKNAAALTFQSLLATWCTNRINIQQLYALSTLYLCVLYLSENKQRLVPLTA